MYLCDVTLVSIVTALYNSLGDGVGMLPLKLGWIEPLSSIGGFLARVIVFYSTAVTSRFIVVPHLVILVGSKCTIKLSLLSKIKSLLLSRRDQIVVPFIVVGAIIIATPIFIFGVIKLVWELGIAFVTHRVRPGSQEKLRRLLEGIEVRIDPQQARDKQTN